MKHWDKSFTDDYELKQSRAVTYNAQQMPMLETTKLSVY